MAKRVQSVLLVYSRPLNTSQQRLVRSIRQTMKGVKVTFVERRALRASHFSKKDLVVTIGGDGTFLLAAQHNSPGVVQLGVNIDPSKREGFLLSVPATGFGKLWNNVKEGKYRVSYLETLQASIGGKQIPVHALNEFYIGSAKAYRTARYEISFKKHTEPHRSSGVIMATCSGVNAWANSAYGRKLRLKKEQFAYVVREPYQRKVFSHYRIKKGVCKKGELLKITSRMDDMMVIADSLSKEYKVKNGQKVVVTLSSKKIPVIS